MTEQVAVVTVVVVVASVVEAVVPGRQVEGQKPYSPSMWVPAVVVQAPSPCRPPI